MSTEHNASLEQAFLEAVTITQKPMPGSMLPDYKYWNQVMRGFPPHQYTILCGPTGAGKTTLLANLSVQLLKVEVPQFVMSIETGLHDYALRCAAAFAGKDFADEEPVRPETWDEFSKSAAFPYFTNARGRMRLSRYETRLGVDAIMRDIQHHVDKFGTQVVFIDNLNFLLEVRRASDAVVEMDRVTHTLIEFVKKCPIHVVMIMHPRKTEDRRISSEYDIKGSSTAVQVCSPARNRGGAGLTAPDRKHTKFSCSTDRVTTYSRTGQRSRTAGKSHLRNSGAGAGTRATACFSGPSRG